MRRGPTVAASPAPHATRPLDGTLNPAMMRNAVDLPHPDGPSNDTNSPGRTSRSRRSSATTPLANGLPTPSSATTAGADKAGGATEGAGTFRNQVGGRSDATLQRIPAKRRATHGLLQPRNPPRMGARQHARHWRSR